jgi:hypothetical protein
VRKILLSRYGIKPAVNGLPFGIINRRELVVGRLSVRHSPIKKILLSYIATATQPSIQSITTPAVYLAPFTINGVNFGSTQGTVTIGDWPQTVTTWSATQIVIASLQRGLNPYGQPITITVTAAGGLAGNYTYPAGVVPETGWSYVTLTSINPTAAYRLTTTPVDLAVGDQVAWGNIEAPGTEVVVLPDASIVSSSYATFDFEAWTTGAGWGSQALVTLLTTAVGGPVNTEVSNCVNAGLLVRLQWEQSNTVPFGNVISVVPASGTSVPIFSYVTITGSLGPVTANPPTALVPNVVGLPWPQAQQVMAAAGLQNTNPTYAQSASVGAGTVTAQSLTANTLVAWASTCICQLAATVPPASVLGTNVTVP